MSLRPSVSYWNAGRKKTAGRDRGIPDFAQFAALLEGYRQDGEWDDYFPLAGAQKFQAALAAEAARTGETDALGPLRSLTRHWGTWSSSAGSPTRLALPSPSPAGPGGLSCGPRLARCVPVAWLPRRYE